MVPPIIFTPSVILEYLFLLQICNTRKTGFLKMGQLRLNFSNNSLTNIPARLIQLHHLESLDIRNNPLSEDGRKNWEGLKADIKEASPGITILD
jgi:hypothetical protein